MKIIRFAVWKVACLFFLLHTAIAAFNAGKFRGPEIPGPDDPKDAAAAQDNIQLYKMVGTPHDHFAWGLSCFPKQIAI